MYHLLKVYAITDCVYCDKMTKFECLHCGRCCEKIIRTEYGLTVGMLLKPSEIRLFLRYSSVVQPYLGIARIGKSKPKRILLYQLAVEPCPLYDADTKSCTQYDSRPVACRAYPFALETGRLMVDSACKWLDDNDLIKGDEINADWIRYAHEIHNSFYFVKDAAAQSPDLPERMIFDVRKQKWLNVVGDIIDG